MYIVSVPACAVKPGQTILAMGVRWIVSENLFIKDAAPPQRVIICDAHPEDVEPAGVFAKGMHFGMLNDAPTTLVV